MKTYKVDCGTLHRKVEARSRESAAVKAIKLYPPRELGYLVAVTPEGEAAIRLRVGGLFNIHNSLAAIGACRAIQPKLAIPMHYGTIVGSAADAETFRKGVSCRVEVLTPEP